MIPFIITRDLTLPTKATDGNEAKHIPISDSLYQKNAQKDEGGSGDKLNTSVPLKIKSHVAYFSILMKTFTFTSLDVF